MIINFRFFDKEEWSIYATCHTIIFLITYGLFKMLNLKVLILSSLFAMLSGELIPKMIFSSFLSLLVWDGYQLLNGIIITLFLILVTSQKIYIENIKRISKYIIPNIFLKNIIRLLIVLWFILIIYLIKLTF